MSDNKVLNSQTFHVNYLTTLKSPPITSQHMYDQNKNLKTQFTYVKGSESHQVRRKMILDKHPEIAKLLTCDKPYTIFIALFVIIASLVNCYYAKDFPLWLLLLDAYLIGGLLNHTLHCCIHDFTHFAGHTNANINRFMAILCNIPMGIPSALSFGRYHSDHHNFLNQYKMDPDLPIRTQSTWSVEHKWYKYFFYAFIELFYALRPIFMQNKPTINFDELVNYAFIIVTNILIYYFWGSDALLFTFVAGLSSIGPHPAAVHIIAEHYEFIPGQESYDYLGIWNIPNINMGYHLEHHDFPNCPWHNLPKIRAIAPEFYEYLPYHTSYWSVWKKFITDSNFTLFSRTIRVKDKSQ